MTGTVTATGGGASGRRSPRVVGLTRRVVRALRRELFPLVERLPRRAALWTAVTVLGAVGVVALALVVWRPWPSAADVVWGEDGPIFLGQALTWPLRATVLMPYNGYAHVVPRVLTELVLLLPPHWWALAVTTLSAVVRAALGAVVWYALAAHVPSRTARGLVAGLLVSVPIGNYETLNNFANLHWFLMAAAVPVLVWRPATARGRVVQSVVVAGAVLSDPVTCLLAPLVVLRVLVVRGWRDQIVSAVFVAASALQGAVVLGTDRVGAAGMSPTEIVPTYLARVVLALFGGQGGTEWAFNRWGWLPALLAAGLVAAVLAAGARVPGSHRGAAVACAVASFTLYVVGMLFGLGADALAPVRPLSMFGGARYGVAPVILLGAALAIAGSAVVRRAHGRFRFALVVGATALVVVYAVGVASSAGRPTVGPSAGPWRTSVDSACLDPAEQTATIFITPASFWVYVPCDVIVAGR